MKMKKPHIKISCGNCGREFKVFPYRKDIVKFCSHKCKCKSEVHILNAKKNLRTHKIGEYKPSEKTILKIKRKNKIGKRFV